MSFIQQLSSSHAKYVLAPPIAVVISLLLTRERPGVLLYVMDAGVIAAGFCSLFYFAAVAKVTHEAFDAAAVAIWVGFVPVFIVAIGGAVLERMLRILW
jgi:hypothetical protein